MVILGIDPGTAITGYGLVNEDHKGELTSIAYGVIRTEPGYSAPARLRVLFEEVSCLIDKYTPDIVSIEQLFFNRNVTTALSVGQARGVAMLAAARKDLPIFEFTPLQVKQAVAGYGRADKKQVQAMVRALLSLPETPKPDDAADALAIAICCSHSGSVRNLIRVESKT